MTKNKLCKLAKEYGTAYEQRIKTGKRLLRDEYGNWYYIDKNDDKIFI